MQADNKRTQVVVITETKWIGRYCIQARAKIDRQTGMRTVEFVKWINARWVPSQNKLFNGYWTPVKSYEFQLWQKIQKTFAHMLISREPRKLRNVSISNDTGL